MFVADEQDAVPVDLARWQSLARSVLATEGVRGHAEMSLLFIAPDDMAELNSQFMGKQGPTDVLAFPIDASEVEVASLPARSVGPDRAPADPGDMPLLLGDVVVCPTVAAAQAPEHAGTLDDELALLVVHGILHVLGHDRIMWGHDAPHDEGSCGLTEESLRVNFCDFSVDECRTMLTRTAADLYRFDLDALAPVAARIGPRIADVHTPLAEPPVAKGSAFWEPTELRTVLDR